ncbi:MAG: hypothetical protein HYZ00_10785, partial [Candidatus Hydrogenedentes bacterium]|nr:hypothetical protein [Candidatus Hydrogenedentota bacterium]
MTAQPIVRFIRFTCTPVLRAAWGLMRQAGPDRYPDLRWRGLAFDRFDGRAWSLADPVRTPVRRTRDGAFAV